MNRQVILGGRCFFPDMSDPVEPGGQVCDNPSSREQLPAGGGGEKGGGSFTWRGEKLIIKIEVSRS